MSTRLFQEDQSRISFESGQEGYLYVASRDRYVDGSIGRPHLYFPSSRTYVTDDHVVPGRLIDISGPTNSRPYLTLGEIRTDQAGEVITILIVPRPIPRRMVTSEPAQLDAAMVGEWRGKNNSRWGSVEAPPGGLGAWTAEEKAAVSSPSVRLTSATPQPHTILKSSHCRGGPLLLNLPVLLAE